MPAPALDEAILADLVAANHILYNQGVVDAYGHVSLRDPARPDRFWISRSKAPAMVSREDILCVGLDGNTIGDERRSYLERFIHCEVYRARPDVMSVIHSHSPAVVPFGVVDVPFRPVCHMCGFLAGRTPVFEIRECAGMESSLLVTDARLGKALARSLADKNAVLMRGHGVTVVGRDLPEAVYRGVYTELNAKLQFQALQLSPNVTYLTDEEARAVDEANRPQISRAWELWRATLRADVSVLRP